MNKTGIEYLDYTWNPLAMRCTPCSPGCDHCWHLRWADRHAANPNFTPDIRAAYAGKRTPLLIAKRLQEPLKIRGTARIGVQFMGDLFHEDVPFDFVGEIFDVMDATPEHTYQILTKRPKRMASFMDWMNAETYDPSVGLYGPIKWPSNVWLGVTAENQEQADKRIPILLQILAAVHYVSIEPMLSSIDLDGYLGDLVQLSDYDGHIGDGLDWVICGAETGPDKRPMQLDWARSLRDQCIAAGTSFFFKKDSNGNHTLDGVLHEEFPQGDFCV